MKFVILQIDTKRKSDGISEGSLIRLNRVRRELPLSEEKAKVRDQEVFVNTRRVNSSDIGYPGCPNRLVLILRIVMYATS